ncbi:MAG: Asp-tRNA(Asn)/Glu-tRNA(Gln) amidotransferase subunit GatC [Chloroflexota bacterium]
MSLSTDEVRHIAWLARLAVTDEEIERFRADLSVILDHFSVLQNINTDNVPAATHASQLENVLREDTVRPSLASDSVLVNAPKQQDGLFRVPPIIE